MSSRDTALAVLLRKAEWMLDEAAFEVGGTAGVDRRGGADDNRGRAVMWARLAM